MFSVTAHPLCQCETWILIYIHNFFTLVPLKHVNSWSQLQCPGRLQQVVQEVCVWLLLNYFRACSAPVQFEWLLALKFWFTGQWQGVVRGGTLRWQRFQFTSIPLVLWTEEIRGVGFLYLLNFNGWQWGSTFALQFNIINKHLCLWSWSGNKQITRMLCRTLENNLFLW